MTCTVREGLPQGSVLAPILFLFVVNDLASNLSYDVLVRLFADDLAVIVQEVQEGWAEVRAQKVLNVVET